MSMSLYNKSMQNVLESETMKMRIESFKKMEKVIEPMEDKDEILGLYKEFCTI